MQAIRIGSRTDGTGGTCILNCCWRPGYSAYGYNTYILDERELSGIKAEYNLSPRVHKPDEFVLENRYIKAVFDTKDAKILSLTDKASGKDLIDANKPAGIFRLIREDDSRG